jgi:flagellar basal-body rod protein FlgG
MSGSHYIALSGLRARVDQLDRLASDIANVGTSGYKGERGSTAAAERDTFDRSLQSAIDTTMGARRVDMADGALAPTGRALDLALDGEGFFTIDTPNGPRYTRNGHFSIDADRKLVTEDGMAVLGSGGPIVLPADGEVRVDTDGNIWADQTNAGRLQIVKFADPGQLGRDQSSRLRAGNQTAEAVDKPVVRSGSLEQSNVSVADRLSELTSVSRSFEALQKSISLMLNDVDGRAIEQLGRRF